jgi:hypothetical protein
MKDYLNEIKTFYRFVSYNFSHYKRKEVEMKHDAQPVWAEEKVKSKVQRKSRTQK